MGPLSSPDVGLSSSERANFRPGLFPKAGVQLRRRVAAFRVSPAAPVAFIGIPPLQDLSFPKTPQLVWRSIRQKRHPGRTNARDGGPSLLVSSVCFAMQWM
ncbi:hypothetical protein Y032_0293g1604 [Ancylostoma ceylanicum]|nr:hypothetical protein Y032_0293g1604 [Ancylostoma ceylanicum]